MNSLYYCKTANTHKDSNEDRANAHFLNSPEAD